jgi:hypothetical protein
MTDKTMKISVIIGLNGYNKGLEVDIPNEYIDKVMKKSSEPVEKVMHEIIKATVEKVSNSIIKNIKVNPDHMIVVNDGL